MGTLVVILVASAAFPIALAWRMNRGWTIRHALAWTWPAWLAWLIFAWAPGETSAYAALSFTAAAGIAVLGARRPVVGPWNFIVASLLVVLWVGWAEGLLDGSGLKLGAFRLMFISGLLFVGLGNYLLTRSSLAAVLLGSACTLAIMGLAFQTTSETITAYSPLLAALSPWAACLVYIGSPHNGGWKEFRNRFGAVWALRLSEQFNAAAANRGWPVRLRWNGLDANPSEPEWESALTALMKRFRNDEKLPDHCPP